MIFDKCCIIFFRRHFCFVILYFRSSLRREEEEHNRKVDTFSQPGGGHQEDNFKQHKKWDEENWVNDNKVNGTWDRDKELNRIIA